MHFLRFLISAILLSPSNANNFMKLVEDFTQFENTGRIRVCNLITCWGQDNMNLVKEISNKFTCYIAVNPPAKPVSEWFVQSNLQLFVVDLACDRTHQFLKDAEGVGLFNGNLVWLVVNTAESTKGVNSAALNGSSAADVFQDVHATAISQVHVARRISEEKFKITGLYKRDPADELKHENLGYWTEKEGVVYTAVRSPAARRRNMDGRVFKGSIVLTNDDSLNHFYDLVDPEIDNASKINMVSYNLAIQGMNASIEIMVARTWGEKVNGTYDGMIGDVVNGNAELALSPSFITYERAEVLSFVGLTEKFSIKFIFLSPPLSYKNNVYLLPFDDRVWYGCFALFVFFVIVLRVVAVCEEEYGIGKGVRNRTTVGPLSKSWTDIVMLNVGTICQQDVSMEPKGIGGRISILCVKVAVLYMYIFYSAAILVFLQSSDRSINNLKKLDESNLKIGVHDTPYNRFYFRTATDPVRKTIARKANKEESFMNVEDGLGKVKSGLFAFHVNIFPGYLAALRQLDETEKCRLQELDEFFVPPSIPYVALRKNLPFAEILRIMFKKLHEVGLVKREGYRKGGKKPPCKRNMMAYLSMGLSDSEATFIILAYGMVSSVVILAFELCFSKYESKKQSKIQPFEFVN